SGSKIELRAQSHRIYFVVGTGVGEHGGVIDPQVAVIHEEANVIGRYPDRGKSDGLLLSAGDVVTGEVEPIVPSIELYSAYAALGNRVRRTNAIEGPIAVASYVAGCQKHADLDITTAELRVRKPGPLGCHLMPFHRNVEGSLGVGQFKPVTA